MFQRNGGKHRGQCEPREIASLVDYEPTGFPLLPRPMRQGGSRFVEGFEAPRSPRTHASVRQASSKSLSELDPTFISAFQPPPAPPPKSVKRLIRRYESILVPTSSDLFPTPPAIHVTSPSPHLATTRPFSPSHPSLSSVQTIGHGEGGWHPSRPAPLPPNRRKDTGQSEDERISVSTPTSVYSYGRRDSGRSWRDSTISALDRVLKGSSAEYMLV